VNENLLDLGRRWCPTDYAVRHFHNPAYPKFFGNVPALLKAVRRASANLPKKERADAQERIEAASRIWTTDDETFRQSVFDSESRLIAALLALNDQRLLELFEMVDFGDDHTAYWRDEMGMGYSIFISDGYSRRSPANALHHHLELLLQGKQRHENLAFVATGLATLDTDIQADGQPDMETISCRYGELADMVKHLNLPMPTHSL
jgi:hypothetical protein